MLSGFILAAVGSLILVAWAGVYGFIRFPNVESAKFAWKRDRLITFLGVPAFALALIVLGALWMAH